MIKKIKSIKNMATFLDFDWGKSFPTLNGQSTEFKEINIFYGRNYSGKTTLSRIIRALDTGALSNKYTQPEFCIEFKDTTSVTQTSLTAHTEKIRVFNEDFVRENLRFIYNPDESIQSFAIGSKNAAIETEIANKELTLGYEIDNSGLYAGLAQKRINNSNAELATRNANATLKNKLDDKATGRENGIKYSPYNYDQNYTITKLEADITKALTSDYLITNEPEIAAFRLLLKEDQKLNIIESASLDLKLQTLASETKALVEQKITLTEPIQELLTNQILEDWVKKGVPLHEHKRTNCGFCGEPLKHDLWQKLSNHFNEESQALEKNINLLLEKVWQEITVTDSFFSIISSNFYSEYTNETQTLKDSLNNESKTYKQQLKSLEKQLEARQKSISTPITYQTINDNSSNLEKIRSDFESLRAKNNDFTANLDIKKSGAKEKLRLQEVHSFVQDIGYVAEKANIATLEQKQAIEKLAFDAAQTTINQLKSEIQSLKDQLSDEGLAATQVNNYLHHFFGHAFLSIEPVKEEAGFKFEVMRSGAKAHHLSEGECSLIAFCYFMAKLDDVETKDSKPIIWIDDPISSLDGNHIFFIYSLISSKIVKSEKFKQLFVSTHNLDFLKYLKRLHDKKSDNRTSWQRNYFLIDRTDSSSQIRPMPQYLKKYATEFNYLFEQLYLCATAKTEDAEIKHDCFYNYGNNARKFLNAYLFYHHPNPQMDDGIKLQKFLGDDIAYELLDRLHNEHSHLEEFPDRSMKPIDIPEMQKSAKLILTKISEKNSDQFNGLCESIDISSTEVLKFLA